MFIPNSVIFVYFWQLQPYNIIVSILYYSRSSLLVKSLEQSLQKSLFLIKLKASSNSLTNILQIFGPGRRRSNQKNSLWWLSAFLGRLQWLVFAFFKSSVTAYNLGFYGYLAWFFFKVWFCSILRLIWFNLSIELVQCLAFTETLHVVPMLIQVSLFVEDFIW